MIKTLLLFGSFAASLFAHGCKSAAANADLKIQNRQSSVQKQTSDLTQANNSAPKTEKSKSDSQTVNFKGVSFNYNPQIFGEVETKQVAELPLCEGCKPDSVAPEHLLFSLKNSNSARKTEIRVFPIEDYRRMFVVSKDVTEAFDEELKNLRKAIKDKNFRIKSDVPFKNQIPFIPFWDGSQTFLSKVKNFAFQNGRGIFFLTQFDFEVNLINNERLTYYFEGITNDGKYYILAEFPVSASFLPNGDAKEFDGFKISEKGFIETDAELKEYEKYVAKVAGRLENLSSEKYEPNLNYFEEIISSLKIEK